MLLALLQTAVIGFLDEPCGLKEHSAALRDVDGNLPIPQPDLKSNETDLQITDEKQWTAQVLWICHPLCFAEY
jgi:hypothetical protein